MLLFGCCYFFVLPYLITRRNASPALRPLTYNAVTRIVHIPCSSKYFFLLHSILFTTSRRDLSHILYDIRFLAAAEMAFHGIPFEQLGVPWYRQAEVALPPLAVLQAPVSTWGIAYDLLTRNIEDLLDVGGWGKRRSSVYREIARLLTATSGFYRAQKLVWQRWGTALHVWTTMMHLREIRPHGIFATVVRRLQMYRVPALHALMVTNQVQLGGVLSPALLGPTPTALAQGMGHIPQAPWPNGPGDRLPFGVRNLPTSFDPNNWRVQG